MTVHDKFVQFRDHANTALIERDEEIALIQVGLLTGQNVFFCGAPGTAKSLLANMLVDWIGGKKFQALMTKHTMPEELFGPIDVQALTEGVYRRIITNKLPEASVAFLDEIWKASSAISNTLLELLNEGTFTNNGGKVKCPLRCCIAASNETPNASEGGRELAAMFDRFLLRKFVSPVATESGLDRLLWGDINTAITDDMKLSEGELEKATAEVDVIGWTEASKEAFEKILRELHSEGIMPGDRRKRASVKSCQASAWMDGSAEVESDHLDVLAHVLWVDPEEQPKKVAKVVARHANPAGLVVHGLMEEVAEIMNGLKLDNLDDTVVAHKKLAEVSEKLGAVEGKKAKEALDYVAAQRATITDRWAK